MTNRAIAAIGVLALTSSAQATHVNWGSLGLDEAQINAAGQAITDFSGITGLDVTITGSTSADAPYVHPSGEFWFRSDEGAPGSRPATSITFQFSQLVEFSSVVAFFGDGGIQELMTYSTTAGVITGATNPGGSIVGDNTASVTAHSGASGGATFSSSQVADLTITLDGDDANDLAGVTFSLDLTVVPSPATLFIFAPGALICTRRRR